jgi:hypothetical protein
MQDALHSPEEEAEALGRYAVAATQGPARAAFVAAAAAAQGPARAGFVAVPAQGPAPAAFVAELVAQGPARAAFEAAAPAAAQLTLEFVAEMVSFRALSCTGQKHPPRSPIPQ